MSVEAICIGNDHGGLELKKNLMDELHAKGYRVIDFGSNDEGIVRYPYYAAKVAKAVADGSAQRGILICSTGIGMSIMANKYRGVRASLCSSTYSARMTRAHNNSNILCLGGKTLGVYEALDILAAWLNTEYEGGRHEISLGLIKEAEYSLCTGKYWNPENTDL